ncbi:ATP-dependent (S)-NAD(P)H-hydrate dehydratase [Smittium mucronatum]|uniref:ATP-dependent (S)-NAD(P)H-hydrate dehydratase n=1 Tax=Smittium mucronatum TaxID=133383 RepID=A0A1R0H2R8_9FUNG|nr:ATP-dependent (S)-NAD(P)H-hydrate dehydratase [Smittium mucronatum]
MSLKALSDASIHGSFDSRIKKLVPVLHGKMHKGECGRYTGAPYYAATSSLRVFPLLVNFFFKKKNKGSDLSFVYCEKEAGPVIKSYSPDLIVCPYLRSEKTMDGQLDFIHSRILEKIRTHHVLSVGSGLGDDEGIRSSIRLILEHAIKNDIPIVIDADALKIVSLNPELVNGHKQSILTPNFNEFGYLMKGLNLLSTGDPVHDVENLARHLGNVTIVLKGHFDIITNGNRIFFDKFELFHFLFFYVAFYLAVKCTEKSGLKRCGGQGDILTGAIASFFGFGVAYLQNRWEHEAELSKEEIPMLAAYAGCKVTRTASFLAFSQRGMATQSSYILDHVPESVAKNLLYTQKL